MEKLIRWFKGERLVHCNGECNRGRIFRVHKRWAENFKCNPCEYGTPEH